MQATGRLAQVLACELLVACEALEHRSAEPAAHVASLYRMVRSISPPLDGDRSTSKEIELISDNIASGGWLARIEAECGRLIR